MSRKELVIIAILGFLAIIQTSFVPHFGLPFERLSWVNLIDCAVFAIALFEKRENRVGWVTAFWGGIFLDIYSDQFFGFWILILLAIVAVVKLVLKKYVRIPSFW